MPPVCRTNCLLSHPYSQWQVTSWRDRNRPCRKGPVLFFHFEEICFKRAASCCGAPCPSPPRAGQASLAQGRISWTPSGTRGGCQQAQGCCSKKLERTFDKQKVSLPFVTVILRKETKHKNCHRAEITPCMLSNPPAGLPLLFCAERPGKEHPPATEPKVLVIYRPPPPTPK